MTIKASFPSATYESPGDVIQAQSRHSDDKYQVVIAVEDDEHDIEENDWMLVHKNGDQKFDGFVDSIHNRGGSIKVIGRDPGNMLLP